MRDDGCDDDGDDKMIDVGDGDVMVAMMMVMVIINDSWW